MTYKNPGKLEFKAEISGGDQGNGESAFVYFPFSVEEEFGVKGRVPVNATFDGVPYRGSLVTYGGAQHMILILKAIREKLGKKHGDEIDVTIELDTEERKVEVPEDLAAELKKHEDADKYFAKLAYSHQREYVLYIEEAKKPETRTRRIAKTIEMLGQQKKLK